MRSNSNKAAVKVLLILVGSAFTIFLLENKFLVSELRGETLSHYKKLSWHDQVLLLVDDMEGLPNDEAGLFKEGFFSYGSAKIASDNEKADNAVPSGKSSLKVIWKGTDKFGGWGKGVGKNIDLDPAKDHLNFRIYIPETNGSNDLIKIVLEEDDNEDGVLQKDKDDSFSYTLKLKSANKWQFVSIPLKNFSDFNSGGDGVLNVSRKTGLHTLLFSFENGATYTKDNIWYFDFICFTAEKIK